MVSAIFDKLHWFYTSDFVPFMLVVAFDLDDLQQCGGYMFGSRRDGSEHRSPLRHARDRG